MLLPFVDVEQMNLAGFLKILTLKILANFQQGISEVILL